MSRGLKIGGAIAALTLLIGLVMGFWPVTEDVGRSTGVHCGSAFAPDSSPSGTNEAQTWGSILGYTPSGPFVDTPAELREYCSIFLDSRRGYTSTIAIVGAIGLLATGLRVQRDRREAAAAVASAAAEREAGWRAAGWVPPSEAPLPPAGWVRLESVSEGHGGRGGTTPPPQSGHDVGRTQQ